MSGVSLLNLLTEENAAGNGKSIVLNTKISPINCHTRPQLTNSTDLNSASADQLGATKWHYNHLSIHPPIRPPTYAKL